MTTSAKVSQREEVEQGKGRFQGDLQVGEAGAETPGWEEQAWGGSSAQQAVREDDLPCKAAHQRRAARYWSEDRLYPECVKNSQNPLIKE